MKEKQNYSWKWVCDCFQKLAGFIAFVGKQPNYEDTYESKPWDITPTNENPGKTLAASWDSSKDESWPVTATLAKCSEIAYQPLPEAKPKFEKIGFNHVELISVDTMAGYVLSIGDVAVVVFRGTNGGEIGDWIINFDTTSTYTNHGTAHEGFQLAYLSLKPKVLDTLRRFQPKHVWVTGHSLGGALAVLCAYDLAGNEKLVIHGLMTFGQPMVADKTLATSIDRILPKKFAHFVNGSDIVPRIHPKFHHCGSIVWFKNDKVFRSIPRPLFGKKESAKGLPHSQAPFAPLTEVEFEKMKDLIRNRLIAKKLKDGAPYNELYISIYLDHLMDSYLTRIQGDPKPQEEAISPQRKVGE